MSNRTDDTIDITMLLLRAYTKAISPRPRLVRMVDGVYLLTYRGDDAASMRVVSYRRIR